MKITAFAGLLVELIILTLIFWLVPAVTKARDSARFLTGFTTIHEAKTPLTLAQVEALVGRPARIEHAESTGLAGDVYHYPAAGGTELKIVFVNGVVFHEEIPAENKS